jgi:hypothetical protein
MGVEPTWDGRWQSEQIWVGCALNMSPDFPKSA